MPHVDRDRPRTPEEIEKFLDQHQTIWEKNVYVLLWMIFAIPLSAVFWLQDLRAKWRARKH